MNLIQLIACIGLITGCFVLLHISPMDFTEGALTGWCHMEQKRALATCVAAILPLCLLSAAISLWRQPLDWMQALPYLLGGLGGGFVGGRLFQKLSNLWLRRIFACFLLYGGVRYLL